MTHNYFTISDSLIDFFTYSSGEKLNDYFTLQPKSKFLHLSESTFQFYNILIELFNLITLDYYTDVIYYIM